MKKEIKTVRQPQGEGHEDAYVRFNLSELIDYLVAAEEQIRSQQREDAERLFLPKRKPNQDSAND